MTEARKTFEKGEKQRGADKLARIPVKVITTEEVLRKPEWLKVRVSTSSSAEINRIKKTLRDNKLHTVCEEASCPNLAECFSHGTATFMIMGDICTRRCPFCDVAHGKPLPLDTEEPATLAKTVKEMRLSYVVITSVDRDDERDGGASHFSRCVEEIRKQSPRTQVEILTPDYRGRMDEALQAHNVCLPDVFNHNLETIPRLYKQCRPGSDYQWSLTLLQKFSEMAPDVPTKSGLMLGLGETNEEIVEVLKDLRAHGVTGLTLGQYLQPSKHHLPVDRFVPPAEFDELGQIAKDLGFINVASGPMVRSSYHADMQAQGKEVK
ncbi:lipoyl synthase [Pelagibaculum spongiae]|uniref:Lipoyl synthase n=1 Tax=Pelagibaculum spongiae TaxID=2080658 RepID=A0A2V1H6Q4_9GAMM|nr:lipoyl synthase [Pelagibaculum spongiae]PVZ72112.1 lipoyl synthase [Pelagibaculum spongiae]